MRKRLYNRNVGVLLTEDSYQQLIKLTDNLEVTLSKYIRNLIEKELRENQKGEQQDG